MDEAGAGRVVVCRVGSQRFALPVASVRQVVATPPVSRLPGTPEAVQGLVNVQGALVTSFSGPRLFGVEGGSSEWLVILALADGRVGLSVDEVEDVEVIGGPDYHSVDVDALIRPLLQQQPT